MKDIPIIFSGPMVRALLDGRKTMTRRLAWTFRDVSDNHTKLPSPWQRVQPGDRLWVRENFGHCDRGRTIYRADDIAKLAREREWVSWPKWTPSIHMPRRASRLTLTVTGTKTEALQDMPPDDAIAEGMKGITKDGKLVKYGLPDRDGLPGTDDDGWPWHEWRISPVDAFEKLWRSLHGDEAWTVNPQVVALTFTVHKSNIDDMPKAKAA